MSGYLGDFAPGATVRDMFNTSDATGASITRATNGTISVYKDGGTTQSTAGLTDTEDFDTPLTGVHLVTIDTSADGTFYSTGSDFIVVLSAATIDTRVVNAALFSFSLRNRTNLTAAQVNTECDTALSDVGLTSTITGRIDAAVSTRATPAQVNTEADTALSDVGLTTTITGRIDAAVSTRATPAQVNTEADTALSDVGLTTTITGRIDAAVSTRATPAQVNTEVLDVLTVDTFAEASAVPAATSTLTNKLNWLFALARNKLTQTSTTQTLYADDGTTPVGTSAVADSGTEASRAEWS